MQVLQASSKRSCRIVDHILGNKRQPRQWGPQFSSLPITTATSAASLRAGGERLLQSQPLAQKGSAMKPLSSQSGFSGQSWGCTWNKWGKRGFPISRDPWPGKG